MPSEYVSSAASLDENRPLDYEEFLNSNPSFSSLLARVIGEDPRQTLRSCSPSRSSRSSETRQHRRLALEEELKSIKARSDALEHEIHRADEAASRAEYAEVRLRDALDAVGAAEEATEKVTVELMRSREELRGQEVEIRRLERALSEAEERTIREEQKKIEAEKAARQAKQSAREAENALRIHEARAQGREEGLRDGMLKEFNQKRGSVWEKGHQRGYDEGRGDGVEEGRINGWNEGVKYGKNQGFDEGREYGRAEEREHALAAFDRFIEEEFGGREETNNLAGRWRNSLYYTDNESQSDGDE
ncbi:hypothetical protein PM082_000988 [Marasmius tenuissimus]|nr:hypothetical protein PM082_000988 [Marasmius tenuissimus]